jgi:hypothetical protein
MTIQAADWWARHGTHALLAFVPAVLLAAIGLGADLRAWWRRDGRARLTATTTPAPIVVAAGLSAAAAVIHVAVCPEHFREGLLYGVFFAVTAGCQLGWSMLTCVRYSSWLASAGLLGNAAIVSLWAVTRTVGIPLGPEAGEVERLGVLDLLTAGFEIGVVALCALAIRHYGQPWRTPRRSGYATPSSTV